MLLIRTTIMTLAIGVTALFIALPALAKPVTQLETGLYVRTDGVAHLCRAFEVTPGMDSGKTLTLGAIYIFHLDEGTKRTPSDLDPECEFVETSGRDDSSANTVLTNTSEELCNGVSKSKMTYRVEISRGQMNLKVTPADAADPGYSCTWLKDRTKDIEN